MTADDKTTTTLHDFEVRTLDGNPVSLQDYAGKVLLVVNVASQCGYTPQYAGLQKLYEEYAARGFVVLGFPSNDFGEQEPGSSDEIRQFCVATYGVRFPLFEKVHAAAGNEQASLFQFLAEHAGGESPAWNFCKYLIGRDGTVRRFYPSKVTPNSNALRQDIEAALEESA